MMSSRTAVQSELVSSVLARWIPSPICMQKDHVSAVTLRPAHTTHLITSPLGCVLVFKCSWRLACKEELERAETVDKAQVPWEVVSTTTWDARSKSTD